MKTWIADRSTWLDNNLPGVCNLTTDVEDSNRSNLLCKFFPNPFHNSTTILLQSSVKNISKASLNIFDVTGRKVFEKKFSLKKNSAKEEVQFNLNAGVYFYSVSSEGTESRTGKLIVH